MPLTITNRTLVLAGLFALGATAHAQYQPPPPPVTTAPCKPTKKNPCTPAPMDVRPATVVNPFPFPGENPGDIPDIPASEERPPAAPTVAPEATESKPATQPADGFPFPGEAIAPAAASSSSLSSSSTASDNLAPAALNDEGSTGSSRFARKHLSKVEDLDTREAKDLEVSRYYVSTGNFQAAYLRAKDAAATIPGDPVAHLALAQTAQRLNKKAEAITEYKAYLRLEPDGDKVPAARKALTLLDKKP